MKSLKRISKRRVILALSAGIILISIFYVIARQVSKADLQENLNSQLKISQISISGDTEEASPIGTVEMTIPKGESQSFAVLLKNTGTHSYPDFSIDKTDLRNSSGQTLTKTAIDERVVHNWTQKIVNYNTAPAGSIESKVDELLVKNEKPSLTLPTDSKYNNDPFFSNDITNEAQGLLKNSGSTQRESTGSPEKIKTSLNGNSEKKFFFTVSLPQASQGDYNSVVNFVDQSNQSVVAKFNLKVKTAPYALEKVSGSRFRTGCYTNDQVLADHSNLDTFIKRLRTAHDYGCEQLVFRVNQSVDNLKGLEAISEIGFKGPIILNFGFVKTTGLINKDTILETQAEKNQFTQILTGIKNDSKITVPMLFYGIDEPNPTTVASGDTLSRYDMHKKKVENIKTLVSSIFGSTLPSNIINQVTTSATAATFKNLFNSQMYKTDYPIVNMQDVYNISQSVPSGNYTPQSHETFYYQGYYEIAKQYGLFNNNRFLGGIGIISTGLKGSMLNPVFGYSSTIIRPIYDDLLLTSEMFSGKAWHKQMLTFYPAIDGFIPTLQSEGWREGNMDLRYYLSYEKVRNNINNNFSDTKKAELAGLKSQIESQLDKYRISQTFPQTRLADDLDDIAMDETRELLEEFLSTYYSSDSSQLGLIESLNLTDGAIVSTSPFKIRVRPKSSANISRSDFYLNNEKVYSTSNLSTDGYYEYNWNAGNESFTTMLVGVSLISTSGEEESTKVQVKLDFDRTPIPNASIGPSQTVTSTATDSSTPSDSIIPVIVGVNNLSNYTLVNYDPQNQSRPEPINVAAKVTDNVEVKSVEFWLDGKKVATATHPDLDYVYEASLGVPSLGQHRIDVVAYDNSNNKAQESYRIDYQMVNYPGGYRPSSSVTSTDSQTPIADYSSSADESVTAGQTVIAEQSPISGSEILDVLPKTGRSSLWQIVVNLFTLKWIN